MSLKPAKDSVDVGIFVSDIKKSLDFYHGILGLEKIEELPTGFGTLHRLRFGTSDVKLMDPKKVPSAGAIGLEKQLGIRYLTFVIRDLTGLCAELKGKGVEFTIPETQIRPGTRIAMVKDPDGNILEFVERG
jgi:catechol 2,3-dioxygenase-like lactoylglutathione lyase family enzyme